MISLSLFDMVDGRAAAAAQPALLSLYVELGMHTNADGDRLPIEHTRPSWVPCAIAMVA
jgi:hypothetical protein